MKKLISIVLTITLLATLMSVPLTANAALKTSFSWDNGTANGGLYGKTSGDYATKADASSGKYILQVFADGSNYLFSDSDYVVLDVNFLPISGVSKVYGGRNAGLTTVETTAYTIGQWNHARIVIKETDKSTMATTKTYQPMSLYINGKLIGTEEEGFHSTDADGKYAEGFRFNIGGSSSTVAYVADAVVTESKTNEAPTMPALASVANKFTISGSKLKLASYTTTVADLQQSGLAVRVYSAADKTMTTALADDYVLTGGETIVAEDTANKLYTYYTATITYNETSLINACLVPSESTASADGFLQNTTGQNMMINGIQIPNNKYYKTGSNAGTADTFVTMLSQMQSNGRDRLAVRWNGITIENLYSGITFGDDDRIKFSLLVKVDDAAAINNIRLMENGAGLNVSNNLYDNVDFSKYINEWIRLDIYYQPKTTYTYTKAKDGVSQEITYSTNVARNGKDSSSSLATDIQTIVADAVAAGKDTAYDSSYTYTMKSKTMGKVDTFLNGQLIDSDSVYAGAANHPLGTFPGRIQVNGSSGKIIEFSDFKLQKVAMYNADSLSKTPSLDADLSKYLIKDDEVYVNTDAAVSSLAADSGYTIRAYDGGDYTKALASTDIIDENDIIVVADDTNKNYAYYTVKETSGIVGTIADNNVQVSTSVAGKLIVASYDAQDNLISVAFAEDGSKYASVSIPSGKAISYYQAFVWQDVSATLKPLCEALKLDVK